MKAIILSMLHVVEVIEKNNNGFGFGFGFAKKLIMVYGFGFGSEKCCWFAWFLWFGSKPVSIPVIKSLKL